MKLKAVLHERTYLTGKLGTDILYSLGFLGWSRGPVDLMNILGRRKYWKLNAIYLCLQTFRITMCKSKNKSIIITNIELQVCDTDDIEIDIADLVQGNRYTFRVAAVNEMGQSEWLEADGEVLAKDPWGREFESLQDKVLRSMIKSCSFRDIECFILK